MGSLHKTNSICLRKHYTCLRFSKKKKKKTFFFFHASAESCSSNGRGRMERRPSHARAMADRTTGTCFGACKINLKIILWVIFTRPTPDLLENIILDGDSKKLKKKKKKNLTPRPSHGRAGWSDGRVMLEQWPTGSWNVFLKN